MQATRLMPMEQSHLGLIAMQHARWIHQNPSPFGQVFPMNCPSILFILIQVASILSWQYMMLAYYSNNVMPKMRVL